MSTPDSGADRICGRYRIEECLGVGAMGAVWRATDELLGRTVAVKELLALPPDTSAPEVEQARLRILREARIGARLQHAHVISIYDVLIHEDRPWLVMEYLPAESLAARIALRGPLPAAEVADIGRQMADGLAAAHLAGVVHRDVKPGNVLVTPDGWVKLTDFGISRAIDEVQLTRTGLIAGTPAYLAPEVARGREPTAAADVFGLGAALYAAVEGAPPFGLDDNPYALLHKVATSEPAPPRLAGPLAETLVRLLSVDPQRRPSAAEARDLLAAVATGRDDAEETANGVPPTEPTPPQAAPPQAAPPQAEAPRSAAVAGSGGRRRAPALLGLLLGVLVLVAGAGIVALTTGAGNVAAAPPTVRAGTAAPTPRTAAPATTFTPGTHAINAVPVSTTSSPAATSPRRSAVPASSSPRTRTPSPAPAPAPAAAPAPGTDPVVFVQHYYALLPGNTAAAFALLGPRARSQAGGAVGFTTFYARMQSVTVLNPRRTGADTISGVVRFVQKNGTTSYEPYRFVVTTDGKTMIMDSFSRG